MDLNKVMRDQLRQEKQPAGLKSRLFGENLTTEEKIQEAYKKGYSEGLDQGITSVIAKLEEADNDKS